MGNALFTRKRKKRISTPQQISAVPSVLESRVDVARVDVRQVEQVQCAVQDTTDVNAPLVGHSLLMSSLQIDRETSLCEADVFSRVAIEVCLHILSYLSVQDIGRMQQVNTFWYNLGNNHHLWKDLTERDCSQWESKDIIMEMLSNDRKQLMHRWKRVYRFQWRIRHCATCKSSFRKCRNSGCKVHTSSRDICNIPGGTGVYWTCCRAKPKDAPGCKTGKHIEAKDAPSETEDDLLLPPFKSIETDYRMSPIINLCVNMWS